MGQWCDGFIPNIHEDDMPALEDFVRRSEIKVYNYDKISGVFSFSLKNKIFATCVFLDDTENAELKKLLKEFRSITLQSYPDIELFLRAECEDRWTAFPHKEGECRCCHAKWQVCQEESIDSINSAKMEVDMWRLRATKLQNHFQSEINRQVREKVEEFKKDFDKAKAELATK